MVSRLVANVSFRRFLIFSLLFLAGCYERHKESATILSMDDKPSYVEVYWVTIDDDISFYDGDNWHTINVGSHKERRERVIPETYYITFRCQHGVITEFRDADDYRGLLSRLERNKSYLIEFGTSRALGLTHKFAFEGFNNGKGPEE